jgi:hypothetical protein
VAINLVAYLSGLVSPGDIDWANKTKLWVVYLTRNCFVQAASIVAPSQAADVEPTPESSDDIFASPGTLLRSIKVAHDEILALFH